MFGEERPSRIGAGPDITKAGRIGGGQAPRCQVNPGRREIVYHGREACRARGRGFGETVPTLLILGPLRLQCAAGDCGLGGVKPRRLLAALALHAGEVVSVDRLADVVWGDCPPRSARQNLNTYVWSLRRSLMAAAGGRLAVRPRPPGYMLDVAAGELDWDCFCELTGAAAECLSSDPAVAAGLLRQALDLWRGRALADIAEGLPLMQARLAAMEEARLTALERRIQADLAAGGHRAIVAELAELTAAHPLREQFGAHRMVALYRCGRQAEALSAFHELRAELADELGVEPGRELSMLYQAMLRGDPRLDLPEPHPEPRHVRASAAGPLPKRAKTLRQRLMDQEARSFQGRRAELDQAWGLLAAAGRLPRVLRLYGPPGIGKTAFVHALARMCESRAYPAVTLDSRDFRHDAASLSDAVSARCAAARTSGSDRPLLLAFDTFEEMQDMQHVFWDVFLPGLAGPVLVLLSGRQPAPAPLPGNWRGLVDDLELPGLSAAESGRLLRYHGVTDPPTAVSIAAFGAGNPLYLTVAAQHARSWGTPDVLPAAVARSLIGRMTSEIVGADQRALLEAASLVRTFNEELLAAMTGGDISAAFTRLCSLSFVRVVPLGARLHDLIRESVAAELRWRSPAACQQMRRRAYAYLARLACSAPDAGPYVQELLHLAADSSSCARFYAPSDHPAVRVRPARPDDLPRLRELCHIGITVSGIPAAERIRQLDADFQVAWRSFAVAMNARGAITGFAYLVPLTGATWRAAARTRGSFFATLPDREKTRIMAADDRAWPACIATGATHLPGHDHVRRALREDQFRQASNRHTIRDTFIAYHLLAARSPELPDVNAAGHTRRRQAIRLGDCLVDEWLLRFGDGGLVGYLAEALAADEDS